jgi:hypothetical protein
MLRNFEQLAYFHVEIYFSYLLITFCILEDAVGEYTAKFTLYHAMKGENGSRGLTLLFN